MIHIPRRALLSVSDKTGIEAFAAQLVDLGFDLVSTGGTATALAAAGLPVTRVETVTEFPEILDGRVKTLHPKIHGGLLGDRRLPSHVQTMADHGIAAFGLLVLNLYPFEKTVKQGADFHTAIENIDIGGPAMLRAAAKNHANILPVINSDQYEAVLSAFRSDQAGNADHSGDGDQTDHIDALRQSFAARAFDHTAKYDRLVADWLAGGGDTPLRYGENAHQVAELIQPTAKSLNCAAHGTLLQGKQPSYNNYLDADSAWELCQDLGGTNAVIVKHNNPCGVARGDCLSHAFDRARACDPTSAFGGVIALSRGVDGDTAEKILENFVEVILAPDFHADALEVFARKPNVRLLQIPNGPRPSRPWSYRSLSGAMLRQGFDRTIVGSADLEVKTKASPTADQIDDMLFAFTVAKHTKSNAIILAKGGQTLGIGAGQMSRVDAARIARWKAQDAGLETAGCAVASDAFFPFADGLQVAIDAGAGAVIQPGGSMRDGDVMLLLTRRG